MLALHPALAGEGSPAGESGSVLPFAIAPQPMATALLAWGKQANVQVLTASGSIASWRSTGASGLLTPNAALDELLEGTDLERESYDSHTVVVRQKQQPDNAVPAPVDPYIAFDPHAVTPLATVDVRGILADDGFKADTSRTATRTEANLSDVPQSISVVTREVIASQQAVSIGDVARYVAGVQYVDGYGGSPLFLIRGFDAGNGMTDGMPNGIARTDDLPPLIGIERVEVLRGPEAILGDASQNNNFGGSINVVMKRPQADTVRTLTWSAGEYDGARLGLDLAGKLSNDGAWTYRLVAAGQSGERTPQGHGNGRGGYLAPSFAWQGTDTRVMGGLEYVDNRVPGPEHTVLLGASLATASPYRDLPDTPDEYSTYRTTRAVFEFDHDFSNDWSFHSQGQYVRQRSDGRNWSYVNGGFAGYLTPVARSFRYQGSYWTWQNDLRTTFSHGETTHTVLLGFDVARTHAGDSGGGSTVETLESADTDRDAQIVTTPIAFNLVTGTRMSGKFNSLVAPVTTVQNLGGSWQTNAGLYLQDQVAIGERWNVLAAVRRTTYQLDTHWEDGLPRRQRKSRWVPKLGVVYKLAPTVSLYADTAVGFQPDPLLGKDGQPLPAVTSRQLEVGGKFDLFDQRARLTAAVYRIHVDHSIDLVSPEPPYFATPGPGQTNRGLELEFSGNIAPGFDVLASLTEARIHNHDDTRPTGSPKHQAAVWGSYRFGGGPLQSWGVAAGILARSRSLGRTSAENGQYFGIPGQASVETNVTRYGEHWRLTLGVKNLFARTLYAVNFDDTFVPIRQGRTVLLTGSYDF
ncbi:MAG TPA: TonB-dependent receptor [Luteibacter sp.]|uniref:TonB-dependent siderophore receptor n=1 Tax=Luteibacter sp. TaxID=1886636 RepID=UPI002F3E3261